MKKILIVDDEAQILKTLSRLFLDTDYIIFTAQNSKDALDQLENAEIDMIISDMRMPELDGYKLLSLVKERYPNIIRIILSGYADEKPMFQALLHNVAKLYVFKPWNNDEFLKNINRLFADDSELNSTELQERLKCISCACTISEHCEKMLSLVETENMDTLITEIEQDPVIADLLIKVAKNGVYGAMPDKVKQAAIYIGLHNLKCFLRYACVVTSYKALSNSDEPELLCRHAYLTNRIFLFLFEVLLHKQPAESTMFAGLMHNIGLIILTNVAEQKEAKGISTYTLKDYIQLEYSDENIFHQEVGAHYLDEWDLPFAIYETALYHHRPLDNNIINRELVSCVHIAQAYAWKTLGADNITVNPEVFEGIGINIQDFEKRLSRYLK